jgi:hypothetical protein
MIDLYCRSINGNLPKPATIQELRQLMDAITELGDGADWDMLVYQYVTKTPETHEILNNTRKVDVENYNSAYDKKATIDADDYGVDMQSKGDVEEIETKMPSIRHLIEPVEVDSIDDENLASDVFGVFERTERITHELLSMHMDDDEPEDSAIPDWGTITKDVVFIKQPFISTSAYWISNVLLKNTSTKGEIKLVDEYITRKELSRVLASKGWFIHKRDKNEIIARKYYNSGKVDLRYIEAQGLEIIADCNIRQLVEIFRFNGSENLVANEVYQNAVRDSGDVSVPINDLYEQSNLVAGKMTTVVNERRYHVFGSTQIKRLSEHESFCKMTVLRAPTGARTSNDEEFRLTSICQLMEVEPNPYGERSLHLKAKNVEVALSDTCGTNGTIWIKIDGPVKGNILIELFDWVNIIPIYRCFRFNKGLFYKLLKKGWTPNPRNAHCLYKDGIYARFVYDYVVFTALLNMNDVYDEDGVELLFRTKLNRIKQLEKRYDNK